MTRRKWNTDRDQLASPFHVVLGRLCDSVSARGAALVDAEGETVDYAGELAPFDIRVAAAEWVVVLAALRGSRIASISGATEVAVRARQKTYVLHLLEDGYALVVQLPRGAFGVSRRAIDQAIRELCTEAGLRAPVAFSKAEAWRRVQVRTDESSARRPHALLVDGRWSPLLILGKWVTAAPERETGYRARLAGGAEVTLVREPLGRWYVDSEIDTGEPPEGPLSGASAG